MGRSGARTQMPSWTVAARHRGEGAAIGDEIARDQREQIARLGEGIVPFGPVAPVFEIALRDRIAVCEQHREARFVGGHPHLVAAEHVGPIGEEGDAAEALGLALGAEHAARSIEPHGAACCARARSRLRSRPCAQPRSAATTRFGPSMLQSAASTPSTLTLIAVSPSPSSRSGRSWTPLRSTCRVVRTRVAAGSRSKSSAISGTRQSGAR